MTQPLAPDPSSLHGLPLVTDLNAARMIQVAQMGSSGMVEKWCYRIMRAPGARA